MVTKETIRAHWEDETCGVRYGEGDDALELYTEIEKQRYLLEPYIPAFAQFEKYTGKRTLEIGVGAGTDFSQFVRNGAKASGVDLTDAAINHTTLRLDAMGFNKSAYDLQRADTENLPFEDETFDLVYSWGVLHVTPDTPKAFVEAFRVLKPGGELKAMVYHTHSWTAWMLWFRHALLKFKPFKSAKQCVYEHLESPGTKVYTRSEAADILIDAGYENVDTYTKLGPGDLLQIKPSRLYQGAIYSAIWNLYPRWLVRLVGHRFGLYILMTARKPG
ncbi:MAG: class I SAM-dependent methyltransferase [Chloroflexi bacterium]|nr:class I SAM-dependent methyltransferase [Chloroflexota bacterium]